MNKPDWPSPTDLRCVGGPADGQWYASPPGGYVRREMRGGAVWRAEVATDLTPFRALYPTMPKWAPGLPCESGPDRPA